MNDVWQPSGAASVSIRIVFVIQQTVGIGSLHWAP